MATDFPSEDYTAIPKEADEQVRNRTAYASFGNQGLTATANAHGRLLQITRYFGEEEKNSSGFVCVEFAELPPPYFIVSRLDRLESCTKSSRNGMRFELKANGVGSSWEMSTNKPKMEFFRDRWPRFITATQAFNVNIEYRIYQDIVYQICTYKKKSPEASAISFLQRQTINVEPTFRHLDFTENNQDLKHGWVREINEAGDILRIRKKPTENDNTIVQSAACLCLSLFINGSAQKFSLSKDEKTIECTIDPSDPSKLLRDGEIRITLAYALRQISTKNQDVNSIKPIPFIDFWMIPEESGIKFKAPSLVAEARLNFALKRNLEHILSVCSIPVAAESPVVAAAYENIPLIALTCGDVSGHRISTAASFYAFQILLQALKFFTDEAKKSCKTPAHPCQSYTYDCSTISQDSCKSYDCYMRSRICKVCYGHIKWLFKILRHDNDKKSICPHYWASGEVIKGWEGHTFLRGRSLADIPFYIIKAAEFYKMAGEEDVKKEIVLGIQPVVHDWIKKLDERNKQGKYAFPHFREEPTHIFYFSDHVMIWRGFKSAEDLGMIQELKPNKEQGRELSYTSTKIRTNILKRFTTKNRLSNQRMLTMIRSPPETKFLLQLEDTVLFDAADLGLFEKHITSSNKKEWDNKIDVWKNMINFQIDQIGNEDIDWMHPLQFALAMMMSAKSSCSDSELKDRMTKMSHYSKSILLGSSSSNGLFPGELDENKEPVLFSEELKSEDYWYTTFQLPHILWTYETPSENDSNIASLQLSTPSQKLSNAQDRESFIISKNIPFDNIIDTRNIVEYTDEWMYNEPSFFGLEYTDLEPSVEEFLATAKEDNSAKNSPTTDKKENATKNSPATDKKKSHVRVMLKIIGNRTQNPDGKIKKGYLIDIPKSKSLWAKDKHFTKEISKTYITQNFEMYDPLEKKRLPEKAKKRLLHFYDPNPVTALICYRASSERDKISTFFQRHAVTT